MQLRPLSGPPPLPDWPQSHTLGKSPVRPGRVKGDGDGNQIAAGIDSPSPLFQLGRTKRTKGIRLHFSDCGRRIRVQKGGTSHPTGKPISRTMPPCRPMTNSTASGKPCREHALETAHLDRGDSDPDIDRSGRSGRDDYCSRRTPQLMGVSLHWLLPDLPRNPVGCP